MSRKTVRPKSDDGVVVMFPSSKNFPNVESQNPLPVLKREVEKSLTFVEKTKLELPSDLDSMSQACHSLDVRLMVLEEVRDRLKFYIDDLETELVKQ